MGGGERAHDLKKRAEQKRASVGNAARAKRHGANAKGKEREHGSEGATLADPLRPLWEKITKAASRDRRATEACGEGLFELPLQIKLSALKGAFLYLIHWLYLQVKQNSLKPFIYKALRAFFLKS